MARSVLSCPQVKSQGRELTPEQKRMLAEIQEDEGLLDQTGRIDFSKAANSPSAPPPADTYGPGDFQRGYPPPNLPRNLPKHKGPPSTGPVEEGPAVKAARAAQLEQARRALQDGDSDEGDAVEIDPVTGLPMRVEAAQYGEKGYGLGVGGAQANPRSHQSPVSRAAPAAASPDPAYSQPPMASTPSATAYAVPSAVAATEVDKVAQQLWMLQRREWLSAESLLARKVAHETLTPAELKQLRESVASLVLALSSL
eukprot:scaffold269012_cov34-Tisochrysis_lutea.AAC.1